MSLFEQVLLRGTTLTGELHLSWIASQQGEWLVQVYVNDELYDVSIDSAQREMWLYADLARLVHVELVMVEVEDAWVNVVKQLGGWTPAINESAEMAMVRNEAMPIDARVVVSVDGVDQAEGRLWSAMDSRSGFGGLFGESGFGRDAASALGLGLGEFGMGPHGMDGTAWRWRSRELLPGGHALRLRVMDGTEQTIAQVAGPRYVTMDQLPAAAGGLNIDKAFTLHIQP